MVVFTCCQCGQAVKKNQVEKHINFQCRGCQSLSCMDCGKTFWGDEHKEHTKCISEDQKYGGKNYQAKPSSNKGEIKQEKWIEHIKNTIATKQLSGPLSNLLQQIIEYPNIPRKKSKFENFLKNSLNIRNPRLMGEAWEVFAEGTKNESASQPIVNGSDGSQKRPLGGEEPPNKKPCLNGGTNTQSIVFNWTQEIENVLSCHDTALPLAKLRKMVIENYKSSVKDSTLTDKELKKKFKHHVSKSGLFNLTKVE